MRQLNSALEFDARMGTALTGNYKSIYDALTIHSTMQVVESVIYSAKVAGAVTSYADLFKSDDVISVGKCNLSQATLPANTAFLITGIALQYALSPTDATDPNLKIADWGLIPTVIRNGEISLTVDSRPVLDKLSCEVFHSYGNNVATGDTNVAAGTAITYTMQQTAIGLYKLEKPKWIFPNQHLAVDLRFAGALAGATSAIRIMLFGAKNCSI